MERTRSFDWECAQEDYFDFPESDSEAMDHELNHFNEREHYRNTHITFESQPKTFDTKSMHEALDHITTYNSIQFREYDRERDRDRERERERERERRERERELITYNVKTFDTRIHTECIEEDRERCFRLKSDRQRVIPEYYDRDIGFKDT